jgi:hypothetical protein
MIYFQRDSLQLEPTNVANCISKGKSEVSFVELFPLHFEGVGKVASQFLLFGRQLDHEVGILHQPEVKVDDAAVVLDADALVVAVVARRVVRQD